MKYSRPLDGLRGLAVTIVILAHAGFSYPHSGGVGVDIFFVLSGFLITSILSAEIRQTGSICFRDFYIRRALRLFPCLIVATSIFAGFVVLNQHFLPIKVLLITLTYTSNWARAIFGTDMMSLNQTWSLAIEEQYYLLWPWVVMVLERKIKSALSKGQVLLMLALALALYRALMVGTYSSSRIYFALDTHMDGLVLGSALSYLLNSLRDPEGLPKSIAKWLSYVAAPLSVAALLLTMYLLTWNSPWMGWIGFFLTACASAFIISDICDNPRSPLARILSFSPIVYIGRISYGIYLLHIVTYDIVDHFFPGQFSYRMALLKIAASVIVAACSYHIIEKPFLNLKAVFQDNNPGLVSGFDLIPSLGVFGRIHT
jgi:peptidoglycan/LPS O-acetylase OafA/YrhL